MKVDILNKNGESTGRQVELPASVFGVEPNEHAVYLDIKAHMAARRQGTHAAKERNAVKGSTRKIKRQKGTGGARAGDIKNPLFRGGGRVFGPRPRTYSQKVNKKVKQLARNSAYSHKLSTQSCIVVEDFSFDTPKTKEYNSFLTSLGVNGIKTLHLTGEHNANVYLSCRNLATSKVMTIQNANTYGIVDAQKLIISESAVKNLIEKNS